MRAMLAFGLLLLGLGNGAPEPEFASLTGVFHKANGGTSPSLVEIEISTGRADRLSVVALAPRALPVEILKPTKPRTIAPSLTFASASADIGPEAAARALLEDDQTNTDIDSSREVPLGDLCNAMFASAQDNDLPIPFFANLLWQESGLRNDIVSSKGALGIAQFMPETAAENGLADPFDPMQAIPASARFLRELRMEFGNLGFVAAAYNAGPHRVIDWLERRASLPQETRDYVLHITGLSIDAWRRIAVKDDALTFVQPLPCRSLPAFASMEQAQSQQALIDQAKLQRAAHDEAAAEAAPKPRGGSHKAAGHTPPRARREAAHGPRAIREKHQSA